MSDTWNMQTFLDMRNKVWATRDGCINHYPRPCPADCPNAGAHDEGLGDACDCRECGFGQADDE